MSFRDKNRQYAIGLESAPGTDATPNAATDAVKIEPTKVGKNFETVDTSTETTGSLSASNPIPAGGFVTAPVSSFLRSNGAPGTSGPKVGRFLQAGACSETLLAAAVANTAQAGSSSTIQLHAGASSVTDIYKGMVIRTTAGTGPGQMRVITAYNGTTKNASVYPNWSVNPASDTEFSIEACALYRPVSSGLKAASFYQWEHHNDASENSILTKLIGAMGSVGIEIPVRQPAKLTTQLRGLFPAASTDVSKPAAPVADEANPPLFMGADAYLGGTAVKFNRFMLNFGLSIEQFDNPAAEFGYDPADVVARKVTFELNPQRTHVATRDAMSDFLNGTSRMIWLRWGKTAGHRFSLFVPGGQYESPPEEDTVRGLTAERLKGQATGRDAEFFLAAF